MSSGVLAALGLKVSTLVAGFCGSVVNIAASENMTRTKAAASVLIGTLCAAYLPQLILAEYHLGPTLENGVAFVCGLCGLAFALRILSMVEGRRGGAE